MRVNFSYHDLTKNLMKANPDKFQAICIGKKTHDNIESFQIGKINIKCDDSVTLLGINIDYMPMFLKLAKKPLNSFKTFGWIFNKARKTCNL